jgi:MFS family permease
MMLLRRGAPTPLGTRAHPLINRGARGHLGRPAPMTTIRGSECSEVAKKRSPTPRGGRILRSFSAAAGVYSRATPANIGYAGSLMFGLFLIGWGLSFIWGPISDKFSRTKAIAATVLVYAVFIGAAAFAPNVWMLAIFRFLARIGVGGEWAMAGTYVAEAWPEDRRKMGAGYFHTGYYFGFFVAAGLNYTIGAAFGWRAMFLCGLFPVVVSIATLLGVKEPERWEHKHQEEQAAPAKQHNPLAVIFSRRYLGRTVTMSALLTVSIVGLWAGAVYEPTASAAVGLLTSRPLETDLTRVVHCTQPRIFGKSSLFRRFSSDSFILENGWLGL